MNKREKILLILVSAAVVLLLGRTMVNSVILGPIRDVDKKIEKVRKDIETKQRKLDRKKRTIKRWKRIDKQTLARDPESARNLFVSRINRLIDASGLKDRNVKPLSIQAKKPAGVVAYYPVAVNLSARGTLEQITRFLALFYKEPYLAKITGMQLRPEKKGNVMTLSNCRMEAIVLPRVKEVKDASPTTKPVDPGEPLEGRDAGKEYALVWEKDIFRPYRAKPVTPRVSRSAAAPPPGPPVAAPSPPRPSVVAGQVVATVTYGDSDEKMGVYVRNSSQTKVYKVGEQVGDMRIVFVHPRGIVMQAAQGGYVYVPLGGDVSNAQPVGAAAPPELYHAWQAVSLRQGEEPPRPEGSVPGS